MKILLRTGWQVVNIGDIAHTTGFLSVMKRFLPEAEVTAWVSADFSDTEAYMVHKTFPDVRIVKGRIGEDGRGDNEALDQAVRESDMLVHNSGPMLVAKDDVEAYCLKTGKPFGAFGITYDGNDYYNECFHHASFLYFRDSESLRKAREAKIQCPVMGFGPDVAFCVDLRDDVRGLDYMQAHGLEPGKFVCCIPRLRYTPFWRIKENAAFDVVKNRRNEEKKEHDHAYLRETIIRVVRERGMKVLLCPEDKSHIQVGEEMIYSRLPEDVKAMVVHKKEFWLPDEALSIYTRSALLFGNEMHSPIMCIGNGVPAIVCRWEEQTSKGLMWKDIGLSEWLFDADCEQQTRKLADTVLSILDHPGEAADKVRTARESVYKKYEEMVKTLTRLPRPLGAAGRNGSL